MVRRDGDVFVKGDGKVIFDEVGVREEELVVVCIFIDSIRDIGIYSVIGVGDGIDVEIEDIIINGKLIRKGREGVNVKARAIVIIIYFQRD